MIYRTFTDAELRRALSDPANLAAIGEAARRFEMGSDETRRLEAEIESLTVQLADADRHIEELNRDGA